MSDRLKDIITQFNNTSKQITDIAEAFDINLASDLDEFATEVSSIIVNFDEHDTVLFSFAEATLVIDISAHLYSKKVEYFHGLVQNSLDSLGKRLRSRAKNGELTSPNDEFDTTDLDWSPLLTINETAMQTGSIDYTPDAAPYQAMRKHTLNAQIPSSILSNEPLTIPVARSIPTSGYRISRLPIHQNGTFILQLSHQLGNAKTHWQQRSQDKVRSSFNFMLLTDPASAFVSLQESVGMQYVHPIKHQVELIGHKNGQHEAAFSTYHHDVPPLLFDEGMSYDNNTEPPALHPSDILQRDGVSYPHADEDDILHQIAQETVFDQMAPPHFFESDMPYQNAMSGRQAHPSVPASASQNPSSKPSPIETYRDPWDLADEYAHSHDAKMDRRLKVMKKPVVLDIDQVNGDMLASLAIPVTCYFSSDGNANPWAVKKQSKEATATILQACIGTYNSLHEIPRNSSLQLHQSLVGGVSEQADTNRAGDFLQTLSSLNNPNISLFGADYVHQSEERKAYLRYEVGTRLSRGKKEAPPPEVPPQSDLEPTTMTSTELETDFTTHSTRITADIQDIITTTLNEAADYDHEDAVHDDNEMGDFSTFDDGNADLPQPSSPTASPTMAQTDPDDFASSSSLEFDLGHDTDLLLSSAQMRNYAEECRIHIERYLQLASRFETSKESEIAVQKWEKKMQQVLEDEASRRPFSITDYGQEVIELSGGIAGNEVSMDTILDGKPNYEVCRLFLATLLLANQHSVDIIHNDHPANSQPDGEVDAAITPEVGSAAEQHFRNQSVVLRINKTEVTQSGIDEFSTMETDTNREGLHLVDVIHNEPEPSSKRRRNLGGDAAHQGKRRATSSTQRTTKTRTKASPASDDDDSDDTYQPDD